ncbi:unnamed protein product, partial [Laminaria digitata]
MDGASGLHGMELNARTQRRSLAGDLGKHMESGKPLSKTDADVMRGRAENIYKHDDAARKEALSAIDNLATGQGGPASRSLETLKTLSEDRVNLRKNRETTEYYERYDEAARNEHARERIELSLPMELKVRQFLVNEAQLQEQQTIMERHVDAAISGDPNAKRLVHQAALNRQRLTEAGQKMETDIGELGSHMLEVPSHPHPDLDVRGATKEREREDHQREVADQIKSTQELALELGAAVASRTPPGLVLRGAGKGLMALGLDTTQGAAAYTQELRRSVSQAVRDSGID